MKKRALVIVSILLVAAAILGYVLLVVPMRYQRQAERLMKQYAAKPDQRTAQRLAEYLCSERLPKELGNEIFERLTTPQIDVRSTYRSDTLVCIAVRHPHHPLFMNRVVCWRASLCAGKTRSEVAAGMGSEIEIGPWLVQVLSAMGSDGTVVLVDSVGVYELTVRFEYQLFRPGIAPAAWSGAWSESPLATHESVHEVPVAIRVVEPEQAEKVVLKSSPALDSQIKTAFTLVRRAVVWVSYSVGDDTYQYRPLFDLEATRLPENVAFRVSYRDETGATWAFENFFVTQRAGTSLGLDPSSSVIPIVPLNDLGLEPGHHKGVIVLETDVGLAYRDAAMKTVWDGVIELPVEFDIGKAPE